MFAKPAIAQFASVFALALISLLVVVVYWPGLSGPLLLDDRAVLQPLLAAPSSLLYTSENLISPSGPLGRPISMLSFALNTTINGPNFTAWKLTNVVVHLACGWLIYALTLRLITVNSPKPPAQSVALIVAACWLLHPLHVSTVLYLVQRMTQLAMLFSLAGLWCYAVGRVRLENNRDARGLIASSLVIFTPLAALSKEIGLLLPWIIVALEMSVFSSLSRPRWLQRLVTFCATAPLLAGGLYFLLDIQARVLNSYTRRDFTLTERLLTELQVVADYLRWIVLPRRLDFGFYHDDVEVIRKLSDHPLILFWLALFGALLVVAWYLRRKAPLAAFGIALFFIGHTLESTFLGLELMVEHRNYFPSLGVCLVVAQLLISFCAPRQAIALGLVTVFTLGLACLPRTTLWGQQQALFTSFVELRPNSVRARLALSELLYRRGETNLALSYLQPAEQLDFAVQRLRLSCDADPGNVAGAADLFQRAAHTRPLSNFTYDGLLDLFRAVLDQRCAVPHDLVLALLRDLASSPIGLARQYRRHVMIGKYEHQRGNLDAALAALTAAAQAMPQEPFVYYLRAEWLVLGERRQAAEVAIKHARERDGARRYPRIDSAMQEMLGASR